MASAARKPIPTKSQAERPPAPSTTIGDKEWLAVIHQLRGTAYEAILFDLGQKFAGLESDPTTNKQADSALITHPTVADSQTALDHLREFEDFRAIEEMEAQAWAAAQISPANSLEELMEQWIAEDAAMTPEEKAAAEHDWEGFQHDINESRAPGPPVFA